MAATAAGKKLIIGCLLWGIAPSYNVFFVSLWTPRNHGLRGSSSHVLTATGLVNERWQFLPPPLNVATPLNRLPKNWHRWLRRRRQRLCRIWCKSPHGGLLGKWVKYNEIFYLSIGLHFFGNSPTGQTRRRIFTLDGSNDADSRKGVPFGGFVDIAPNFGGEIPPKNNFCGVNWRFQAKLAILKVSYYRNHCIDFKLQQNIAQR